MVMARPRAFVLAVCVLTAAFSTTPVSGRASSALPVLPAGFRADLYVDGLHYPTAMAFGPDRRLYVAQLDGRILAVGNRRVVAVASGFTVPLGLAWHRGVLYVSSMGRISALTPYPGDGSFARRDIVTGLPFGRHQNDEIAFHGGWMYVGVGSTCDACVERDPRSATIMRFRWDGSGGEIVAHGLRNPFGLAFRGNVLYATDNGRDDHDDSVPDELNRIVAGGTYGWPDCWGTGGGTHCAGTIGPVVDLAPHASADGLAFYTGDTFPAQYRGDAFIAEYGATIGTAATGHEVVDVHFGTRVTVSPFAAGLDHPVAVVVDRDGSLLIADWGTGTIWHVQWAR